MEEPGIGVAVVGLGRAGRARVRALEGHPRARLAGVARSEPGPGEMSFRELAGLAGIEAAIVCTPNHLHVSQARALLEGSLHTAVEFPLAPSAAEARGLFELARERGRVLHEEHIELLTEGQARQRERAARLGRPTGGGIHFTGSASGWVGDPGRSGGPALLALARLHLLVDLYGEAELEAARLESRREGFRLEVKLRFRAGGGTALVEERGPGLARGLRWAVAGEGGLLDAPPGGGMEDLFRRDLDCFLDRIQGRGASYLSEERTLHVLGLVDRIRARVG